MLRASLGFLQHEYASQKALRFHPPNFAARATNRYGAWVGFFAVASEVVGTPSFEGYCLLPLFESQDNGTHRHQPAAKPMIPRYGFTKNNGREENCEKDT